MPLLIVGAIGTIALMAGIAAAIMIVLMNRGLGDAAAVPPVADSAPAVGTAPDDAGAPPAPLPALETSATEAVPGVADVPPSVSDDAERVRAARRERIAAAARAADAAHERDDAPAERAARASASEPDPPDRDSEPVERAVRVGGAIRAPRKLRNVQPVYPSIAQQARVQGVVIIEATIDPAGRVSRTRLLRSIPLLDQAALDAVRQWEYEPTLLNGVAVPLIMTVTVNFSLER